MHSGRDGEGLSRQSGRVSLSSSSALWDAPGQATVATEKVIRLFKKFFRMLRKRPCNIRQESAGLGSPSKEICVVPHDCEKSVYRDRCPRPFIAKAEAAVEQARKDGKEVCELVEQDLIWSAAVLAWAAGFNIKQIVEMIEEAGDGQETTRVWNSYMKGVTQSNIELGERAGAQVDWQKRPDLVILEDGHQYIKGEVWPKHEEVVEEEHGSRSRPCHEYNNAGEAGQRCGGEKGKRRGVSPASSAGKGRGKYRGVSPAISSGKGRGRSASPPPWQWSKSEADEWHARAYPGWNWNHARQ